MENLMIFKVSINQKITSIWEDSLMERNKDKEYWRRRRGIIKKIKGWNIDLLPSMKDFGVMIPS